MANAIEDTNSSMSITVTRSAGSTTALYSFAAGSIVNADVSATAGIVQSKLNMNAASTRNDATGISQSDLGLASFDSGDFTVTNGWVTLKAGGVDYYKLDKKMQVVVLDIAYNYGGEHKLLYNQNLVCSRIVPKPELEKLYKLLVIYFSYTHSNQNICGR